MPAFQWPWNGSRIPLSLFSETVLLESLAGAPGTDTFTAESDGHEFTVYTFRPIPSTAVEQRFGSRRASAAPVVLNDPADLSACGIESLESGWLFLIPNAAESTWLLAIGGPVETLLGQSRAVAPRIRLLGGPSAEFSSCPRILSPLCRDGWLACGSVALGFDPICGDGTAHASREAILSSAVIRAIAGRRLSALKNVNHSSEGSPIPEYAAVITAALVLRTFHSEPAPALLDATNTIAGSNCMAIVI